MKTTFVILMFLAVVLPCQAAPQKKDIGVGVILGDPVRLSVKRWIGPTTAIDGAFSQTGDAESSDFEIHVDYLKHDFNMFHIKEGSLPVYYGIGVRIQNEAELTTSVRVPIGLSFLFRNAPVSIFYEYAFLLDVTTPNSQIESETAFGIRYFF